METILIVAADAREFAGFTPKLDSHEVFHCGAVFALSGTLSGRRWLLVANGPGPRLAAEAVSAAASGAEVSRVISAGYCGGLDPALKPGDVVVCKRVLDADTGHRFETADEFGAVCLSGDRVVDRATEKARLYAETGASVVEMEAAGVARQAAGMNVPFHCLKAVTDTAEEDIGIDLNAARGSDGRFRTSKIVAEALRKPRRRIPELMRLNARSRDAAVALGDYLARRCY